MENFAVKFNRTIQNAMHFESSFFVKGGPVFAGDEVCVTLTFKEYEERNQFYIGTFEGVCHVQDGREVLIATCHQLMSKKLFLIEQE